MLKISSGRAMGVITALMVWAAGAGTAETSAGAAETSAGAVSADETVVAVSVSDALAIFGILYKPENINARKVALGEKLFHDPRLSVNDAVSCASCHHLASGGDDGLQFSVGVSGAFTQRNSSSVFNLENQVAYFWDGRAISLEDQIDGPIHHPDEMGTDWPTIIGKLAADPSLVREMARLYGGVNEAAIKDALVQFERTLVTNDSAFDAFLAGNDAALTPEEKRGLSRFVSYGCASCHQGELVGGNLFQEFGVYDEEGEEGTAEQTLLLKVPSLRNVAHTAPYFHDGREPELIDAIRAMAQSQLGRNISVDEAEEIASFLHALSGQRFSGQTNIPSR